MFLYPNRNRPLQGYTEQLAVAQKGLYNDNSGRGAVTVLLICSHTVPVVDQTWEEFQIMISEFVQIISAGFRLSQTLDFKQLLFSNHAPLLYQWEWNHLCCHVKTHLGVCAHMHCTPTHMMITRRSHSEAGWPKMTFVLFFGCPKAQFKITIRFFFNWNHGAL